MNVAIVAGAFGLAFIVTVLAYSHAMRAMVREHARERQLLLNQLLNLAGKPWLPPPAAEPFAEPEPQGEPMLMVAPDQLPDY